MTLNRQWCALLVAGCCWGSFAGAQEETGAPAADPGSASSFSATPAPAPAPAAAPTEPSRTITGSFDTPESTGAASSFTTPSSSAATSGGMGATGGGTPTTGTTSSAAGVGFGTPKAPPEATPTFTLPAFYGSSATTFMAGEGRLSRPRFRYTVSIAQGIDTNVFQTPTQGTEIPGQEIEVLVDPGTPPQPFLVPVFRTEIVNLGGGLTQTRQVLVRFDTQFTPGTPPKFETQRIPPIEPAEQVSSIVTQVSGGVDMQFFSRRSLFTFDLNGNANQYWNRPGPKKTDYNAALVFNFLYRLTPRLQFTAQLNAAYLSQPDYSRINTPDQVTGEPYLNANAKFDLAYRWSPRFTTVSSLSFNSLYYTGEAQQFGNYLETVFGTELRYLWSQRLTLLTEVRYSSIGYEQDTTRNANTAFLLVGFETRLSRRLSGSLRLGESIRTFETSGSRAITPYLESNIAFRLTSTSVWTVNTRFGFEEPSSASEERLVSRTGISFTQIFSPRLVATAGVNYLHEVTTIEGVSEESVRDTIDATVRLDYSVTRDLSLNAYYSVTTQATSFGVNDFYRNRVFVGGEYRF